MSESAVELADRLRKCGVADQDARVAADVAHDPDQLRDLMARMERLKPGSGADLWALIPDQPADARS